jgi:hypothetical protein
MKTAVSIVWMVAFLLLFPLVSHADEAAGSCGLEVHVEPSHSPVVLSSDDSVTRIHLQVTLRNASDVALTLVEPGDGSERGWRTPIVGWQVVLVGGAYEPPELGYCGNINPLTRDEVFTLEPGAKRVLGAWVPSVLASSAGIYRLRLTYKNDPTLDLSGISKHDRRAMKAVRASTPCVATSDEIQVEVIGVSK